MTIERKLVVGLGDIKSVSYECKHCGAKTTFPLGHEPEPMTHCYICSNYWRSDAVHRAPSHYVQLLAAARAIKELEKEAGFRLVMEFDEPSRA